MCSEAEREAKAVVFCFISGMPLVLLFATSAIVPCSAREFKHCFREASLGLVDNRLPAS
jgi:hypothetical protein